MNISVEDVMENIHSKDVNVQLKASRCLKNIISIKGSPIIEVVLNSENAMSELIQFLYKDDNPELQFEAVTVLQIVASGTREQVSTMMHNNSALKALNHLLSSTNHDIVTQAVWTMGFIVQTFGRITDYKLIFRITRMPLIATTCLHVPLLRAATWTISTIINCFELTSLHEEFLPLIIDLLKCKSDDTKLATSLWMEITTEIRKEPVNVDKITQDGAIRILVNALSVDDIGSVMLALRAILIIVSNSKTMGEVLLEENVIPAISELISHPRIIIEQDACHCLKLISDKHVDGLIAVMKNSNLATKIIERINNPDNQLRQRYSTIAFKLINAENSEMITQMVKSGLIQVYCRTLNHSSPYLGNIFRLRMLLLACYWTDQMKLMRSSMNENGGWEEIKACQNQPNIFISQAASQLISEFFIDESDSKQN